MCVTINICSMLKRHLACSFGLVRANHTTLLVTRWGVVLLSVAYCESLCAVLLATYQNFYQYFYFQCVFIQYIYLYVRGFLHIGVCPLTFSYPDAELLVGYKHLQFGTSGYILWHSYPLWRTVFLHTTESCELFMITNIYSSSLLFEMGIRIIFKIRAVNPAIWQLRAINTQGWKRPCDQLAPGFITADRAAAAFVLAQTPPLSERAQASKDPKWASLGHALQYYLACCVGFLG